MFFFPFPPAPQTVCVYESAVVGACCADSFSFMHVDCTNWQLVSLDVSQPGIACVFLSLLRKVPFKLKYRHWKIEKEQQQPRRHIQIYSHLPVVD